MDISDSTKSGFSAEILASLGTTSSDNGYQLQTAITETVSLLVDCQSKYAFDRLAAHLDALLAEQLKQVCAGAAHEN